MEQIKLFFYNHKTWVYNLQYVFFSILLVAFVTLIDMRILPVQAYLPDLVMMDISLSRSILTTLAGSLLTITTFTFSTILVILNTYASSFTPRVVENFLNMKITMKVLGIYIGGFFYCITTLILMRDFFEHQRLIAGTIAILYSIICIIYFIYFVQSVVQKFQGVNLIYDIALEAQEVIEKEVQDRNASSEISEAQRVGMEIKSSASGYLSVIDTNKILSILNDTGGILTIKVKLGQYIQEGFKLADLEVKQEILSNAEKQLIDEEKLEHLSKCFIFQDKKISETNYRYNITKLLEIALRALSPGINDPNTAIHCTNKIAILLIPLGKTNSYHIQKSKNENAKIYYTSYRFEEDLFEYYMPIIEYGKGDLGVIKAVINSLVIIYSAVTAKNKEAVKKLAQHINQKIAPLLTTDLEKELFQKDLANLLE